MNKIFRKCRDFGIMLDLSNVPYNRSLECVKALKLSNIPLCVVDKRKIKNWKEYLRNIAFNEDLFIAVENIETLDEAYEAAGNGAQFFIFNSFNIELYKSLTSSGFFYVPFVSSELEENAVLELGAEVVNRTNYETNVKSNLFTIKKEDLNNINCKLKNNEVFKVITIPNEVIDFEDWGNEILKSFLSLKYTLVEIEDNPSEEMEAFAKLFSATNRCKLNIGNTNSILLTCSDFIRTVNYLKWREFYIDPLNVTKNSKELYNGILDTKLNNFIIKIEEVDEY